MDTSREKEREMNKITQVARGPCPVVTRAAAQGTSHGPSPAAAMEDYPVVAFGRWASCSEMCAAAPGREEDRGRGKVAAGLTQWRSESMCVALRSVWRSAGQRTKQKRHIQRLATCARRSDGQKIHVPTNQETHVCCIAFL